MTIEEQLHNKISSAISPIHLEIINESHLHSVPPKAKTHFKLIIVSEKFNSLSTIEKHQLVRNILKDEFKLVHALSFVLLTPIEFENIPKEQFASPPCQRARKHDS